MQWAGGRLKTLLVALAYGYFGIGAVVQGVLIMPWVYWVGGGCRWQRRRRCQALLGRSSRLFHDLLRGFRLVDFSPARMPPALGIGEGQLQEPLVVVANHPTLVDTTAVLACYPWLVCGVQWAYARNPLLGPLLFWCGHVPVGSTPDRRARAVERLLEALKTGQSLLLFPEGTRSPRGGLGAFNRGAFELARRANVPVLPLFISAEPGLLGAGTGPWHVPQQRRPFVITPLQPIYPDEFLAHSQPSKWLSQHVKELFETQAQTGGAPD